MVSAAELIDPAAKDRHLRALAFFQASLTAGTTDAIDCLVPVVLLSLSGKTGMQFDVEEVSSAVKEMFPLLEIPLYMINEIIPKLVNRAAIKIDPSTHLYIIDYAAVQKRLETTKIDFDIKTISDLEESLAAFAADALRKVSPDVDVTKPLGSNNWEQALIRFFSSQSDEIVRGSATVSGTLVTAPSLIDNTIVGSFLKKAERDTPELLKAAARLYYALTTYNFFRDLESTGNKNDYKDLSVFYDATVLMRLLGTSGKLLKTATLQMHQALQSIGCQVFYFDHTFNEVQYNLERAVENRRANKPVHPETHEAIISGEITVGRIATIARTIDAELGKLGITQHPINYQSRSEDVAQIDELVFTKELDNGSLSYDEFSRGRDAKSLALTMRLRGLVTSRDVAKSKYIFVTHNARFFHVAKRFCRAQGAIQARHTPAVITLGQMTTLSWLASEKPYKEEDVTKELLANCFKAVLPSERWEEEFWGALSSMKNEAEPEKMLQDAIYVDTARRIALEATLGLPSLVRKVVDAELLQRVAAERQQVLEKATEIGVTEGAAITKEIMRANAEKIADHISQCARKAINALLCAACFILFLASLFSNEIRDTSLFWPSVGASAFIGAVTVLDYFGYPLSRRFLYPVERAIRAAILFIRPYST